jgi:malic enzyme
VTLADGSVRTPSQANNVQIFPGVGLGATICQARIISVSMFYAAATELAECVPQEDLAAGMVMPRIRDIRATSRRVAGAVMRCAMDEGIARHTIKVGDLDAYVGKHMWEPKYHPLYNSTYR